MATSDSLLGCFPSKELVRLIEAEARPEYIHFVLQDYLEVLRQVDIHKEKESEKAINRLYVVTDEYLKQVKQLQTTTERLCDGAGRQIEATFLATFALIMRVYLFCYCYMEMRTDARINTNGSLNIRGDRGRLLTKDIPSTFVHLMIFYDSLHEKYDTGASSALFGVDDIIYELIISVVILTCKNNVTDPTGLQDSQYMINDKELVSRVVRYTKWNPYALKSLNKALALCENITTFSILPVIYKEATQDKQPAKLTQRNKAFWNDNFFIRLAIMEAVQLIAAPQYDTTDKNKILGPGFPYGYPRFDNRSLQDIFLGCGVSQDILDGATKSASGMHTFFSSLSTTKQEMPKPVQKEEMHEPLSESNSEELSAIGSSSDSSTSSIPQSATPPCEQEPVPPVVEVPKKHEPVVPSESESEPPPKRVPVCIPNHELIQAMTSELSSILSTLKRSLDHT